MTQVERIWIPPTWVVTPDGARTRLPGVWELADELDAPTQELLHKVDIGEIADDIMNDRLFKELRAMQDRVDEARRKARMFRVNVSNTDKGYGRRHTLAKINLKRALTARRKLWLNIAKRRAYLPVVTGLGTILEGYGRRDVMLRAATGAALAGGDASIAALRVTAGNATRRAQRLATVAKRRTALAARAVSNNTQSFVNASRVWVKPYTRVVAGTRVAVPGFWRLLLRKNAESGQTHLANQTTTTPSLMAA